MAGRLLWKGADTRTYWHQNNDRTVSIETRQDIGPSKERIHRLRTDPDYYRRQFKADGTMHAAHIPAVKQMQMYQRYGVKVWNKHHMPEVMKILRNDPDFSGCIVEPKVFKRMDQAAGMKRRKSGVWAHDTDT